MFFFEIHKNETHIHMPICSIIDYRLTIVEGNKYFCAFFACMSRLMLMLLIFCFDKTAIDEVERFEKEKKPCMKSYLKSVVRDDVCMRSSLGNVEGCGGCLRSGWDRVRRQSQQGMKVTPPRTLI